ncbi:hypothetical protein HDU86_001172 [Geranomyces michiganensis]|nr:hypothetical protein HDU86_001172 [Geranomyces michiganensis]
MKVDIRKTSLGSLGIARPSTEGDIGSGFRNLTVLWMARCELTDLDGIDSMSSLEEVYLAYNEISDLSSLSMLEMLQILDLEGNAVEEFEQIEYLGLCGMLRQLTVAGNPLADGEGAVDVRQRICAALPQLQLLDDVPVGQTASPVTKSKDGPPPQPSSANPALERPPNLRRPGTAGVRLQTTSRSGYQQEDASSDLTHGSGEIMAGNPILFLRSRRASARMPEDPPASQLSIPERHNEHVAIEPAPQPSAAPSSTSTMPTPQSHPTSPVPPPPPPPPSSTALSSAPSRFHPRPPSAPRPATADPQHTPTPPASRPPSSYAAARIRRLRSVSSPSNDQIG